MKNNTTLYIILGAIAAAVIYMLYKNGTFGGTNAVGPTNPEMPGDKSTAQQLKAAFRSGYGEDMPFWLMEIVDEIYTGVRPMSSDYLVAGQMTKSGAIMAAWASSYPGALDTSKSAVSTQMYAIFNDWRASELAKKY